MGSRGRSVRRVWALVGAAVLCGDGFAAADSVDAVTAPPANAATAPVVLPLVPPARHRAGKRGAPVARRVDLPWLDPAPLLAEDAKSRADVARPQAERIGVVRGFRNVRAPRRLRRGMDGVVELPGGDLVWTCEVSSKGAVGLRLHLARCALPPDAAVFVYDAAEPSEQYGPFTSAATSADGGRWMPTVFCERARLELRVPAAFAAIGQDLRIDGVLHDYAGAPAPPPQGGLGPPKVGTCHVDVQCDANYGIGVARGVCRFDFVQDGTGGYSCSGALLNDNDATTLVPWLLTANHCVSSEAVANTVECYWDYYAPTCSGLAPQPQTLQRTYGATYVAGSTTTDVTLLRLTGSLPPSRTFLGWTSVRPVVGESVAGVHHPDATAMRVSKGRLTVVSTQYPTGFQLQHHEVAWTSGSVEPGSSGSPLFNSSFQVVGQLYGGWASCTNSVDPSWYGSFDLSYPFLKPYLWDVTGADPVPGDGSVGGGTGGGEPPEFFLGFWQKARLADGASRSWRLDVLRPRYDPGRTLKLKVDVKGRPGAWARIVDPMGDETIHAKGRSHVTTIRSGYWQLELHAAEGDPEKVLKVRVTKNW